MESIVFPGQGSQYKGMGKDLFPLFKAETQLASDILGYDLAELCLDDPLKQLKNTQFTQPALFTVNAFHFYHYFQNEHFDYLAGHSLGEYNALLAGGAFDFETGLRMVQKRGQLMAAASGGGMAAVIGISAKEIQTLLKEFGHPEIDMANYNSPVQTVIAGPQKAINQAVQDFESRDIRIIPLFVSAPFHSRYMQPAADEFQHFLQDFSFSRLNTPVISNITARPYEDGDISKLLVSQITGAVNWTDSIRYLMGKGVKEYKEVGGRILGRMIQAIQEKCTPIIEEKKPQIISAPQILNGSLKKVEDKTNGNLGSSLGSKAFCKDHSIRYAYVAGAMYRGIASKELVVRMGKAGLIGYLGTGGMSLQEVEDSIQYIQTHLGDQSSYGMNLLHHLADLQAEMKTISLYLKYGITRIEASAYMQINEALVYYRLSGLSRDTDGNIICKHHILAKISRPEVAQGFMQPAPKKLVLRLLEKKLITEEQASLAKEVPMSYDICVEADSGGHTDGGIALVLLPSIQTLRNQIQEEYQYKKEIRVGLAGGIGTPQSVACAFIMGADFVLTGSINQCTVEAGISDNVKTLLQDINVQDTEYAPAGDMFEIGARVQVLKKGVLFAARANKLYNLYRQYNSLEEIPSKVIKQIEKNYFNQSIAETWQQTKTYLIEKEQFEELEKAERNSRHKMALVFRWYFGYSTRLSFEGDMAHKVNFQVHTGPSLGAFNQWVKGTPLASWKNRHVDEIGIKLMEEAGVLLKDRLMVLQR